MHCKIGRRAAIALLLALPAGISSAQQREHKPYSPLAQAILTILPAEFVDLSDDLKDFANQGKFGFDEASMPMNGRRLRGVQITVGIDSHFHMDNFNSENEFNLFAFSHEEPRIWVGAWNGLIDRIISKLGRSRVRVVQPPPNAADK
jgi:hypothetical protein